MQLTQARLKEVLHYNPVTGIFTWLVDKSLQIKAGDKAGTQRKNLYIQIRIDNKMYLAHRLAVLHMKGYFPEGHVDHNDRVRDNNAWNNLEEKTPKCNSRNTGVPKNNKSGVKGVRWVPARRKWTAELHGCEGSPFLIQTSDFVVAVKARWEAEVLNNWPDCTTTSSAYLYLKEKGEV